MKKKFIKFIICFYVIQLSPVTTAFSQKNFITSENPDKQFPNLGQVYVPGKDTGFAQYLAKSLYGIKKVALTFDDGPDLLTTPKLLDILKAENVQVTFFVLTDKVNDQTLPLIKRMIDEGHTVSSHHHDHVSNDTKTELQYKVGLEKTILSTVNFHEMFGSFHREVYYRFPYGAYGSKSRNYHHLNVMKEVSQKLFDDNCINFVFWDIDTVDWLAEMTPNDIAQNISAYLFGGKGFDFKKTSSGYQKIKINITKPLGGGVILMHDVHERSVNAVPVILNNFKKQGVEIVQLRDVKEYSFNGVECRLQ